MITVLSLFDGMSCGRIALDRIGMPVKNYYAAEIDKYAIKVTQANWPNTTQLGSVLDWQSWDIDWASIDLVTGGFPCQAWSVAGKQLGDRDPRGALFWTMLDIAIHVRAHNPKAHFLFENVKMKADFEQYITHHTQQALGAVNKHLICSSLLSAQKRSRYYWTSIEGVTQPEDKGVQLADIILSEGESKYMLTPHQYSRLDLRGVGVGVGGVGFQRSAVHLEKSPCLMARDYKGVPGRDLLPVVFLPGAVRKLSPVEYERLQTVPDNYTAHVSDTQRYKMLGNGWTVDVIAHILNSKCLWSLVAGDNSDLF